MAIGKKISEIVNKLTKIKGTERLVVADEGTNKYLELSLLATSEQLSTKSDKINSIDSGNGVVTQELQPNKYYKFGECSSLTVTLAPEIEGIFNEYSFEFTSGDVATTLAIPESIKWNNGITPTIEPNKKYLVAITGSIAFIGGA